jgi:hypothetical protein
MKRPIKSIKPKMLARRYYQLKTSSRMTLAISQKPSRCR